jgi:hypothetical protein
MLVQPGCLGRVERAVDPLGGAKASSGMRGCLAIETTPAAADTPYTRHRSRPVDAAAVRF